MNRFVAAPLLSASSTRVRRSVFALALAICAAAGAAAQVQQIVVDSPVTALGAAPYLGSGSPVIGPGGTIKFHLTQNAKIESVSFDATYGKVHELTIMAVRDCTQGGSALVTAAGTVCSVDYFLGPVFAGLRDRAGTLRVVTDSGSYTAGVSFAVMGPQVTFPAGTISTLTLDPAKGTSSAFSLDGMGNIYITLPAAGVVEKIDAQSGAITVVAGNGSFTVSGDGGPATAAGVPDPMSVAVAPSGDIYIVANDTNVLNEAVRKVDAKTGLISTVYTFPSQGMYGSVLADRNGFIYVSSPYNGLLAQISQTGALLPLDCSGGHDPYGPPYRPMAIALDGNGHIFFASGNRVIQSDLPPASCADLVDAGAGAGQGYSGDGGPAYLATSGNVTGVAVDAAGDLYFSDGTNSVVRKVTGSFANGVISTVAGTGVAGDSGDGGPATSATLQGVLGGNALAIDPLGNLYIRDETDNVIRKVDVHDASLSFPDTNLGVTSGGELVTVDNIGSMDLTLTAPASGTNPSVTGGFVLGTAGTCPVLPGAATPTLSVGASCTQEVKFLPEGAGGIDGTLTFIDNAGGSAAGQLSQTVGLHGTGKSVGPKPDAFVSPSVIGFVNTPVGTKANPWTVTLNNTSSTPLPISSITVSNPVFSFATTCGAVLQGYSTCNLYVAFTPTSVGQVTGTLTVNADALHGAPTIALSGYGAAGQGSVLLSPSAADFGNVPAGTVSNTFSVNVSNTSGTATKISAIFLSDPYNFRETTNCGSTLAAYSSCQVLVSFAPQTAGYLTSTLEVDDDLAPYHQSISLSGNATGTAIQLAPSSVSFGTLTQYGVGNPYTVNVSNTGGSAVKLSAIFLSDAYDFRETNNCGSSLAAYSSCQVLVSFAPTKVGYLTSTLEVDDDAAPYHLTIPLNGTGQTTPGSYTVSVTPSALSLKAGETGTAAFTFSPVGGYTGMVTFACSGLPNGAACSFAPATLTADGSNKVQVSQLTVTTSGINAVHAMNEQGGHGLLVATVLGLNGLLVGFVFVRQRSASVRRGPMRKVLVLAVLLGGFGAVSGCGAGVGSGSTSVGANAVTVTATAAVAGPSAGSITQTASFMLTIQP